MEEVKQFDVWSCDFSDYGGLKGFGVRPCIVISNDLNNKYSDRVTVVPLTTQAKNPLPTHCIISSSTHTSFALCENVTMVLKETLYQKSGSLNEFERKNIMYCVNKQFEIIEIKGE